MTIGSVRRKFGRTLIFIVGAVIVFFIASLFVRSVFSIQTIEIVGEHMQVTFDEKRVSKNLIFFPATRIRKEVLNSNPWLADVTFKKKYPHTLQIIPTIRTPVASVKSEETIVLIDEAGMVLNYGNEMHLNVPVIAMHTNIPRLGVAFNNSDLNNILHFIGVVPPELKFSTVENIDGLYFKATSQALDIYIPHTKSIDEVLATLQTLLAGFRIKGTLPAVVDLRFDKPIVKF